MKRVRSVIPRLTRNLLKIRGWRIKSVLTILLLLCFNGIQAQSIIEDLQSRKNASDGVIQIQSDPAITALIGTPGGRISASSGAAERQGYRILVLMDNSSSARSEAVSKQNAIRTALPDMPTYVVYESPHWKLLAGDFITREEATVAKQQLQRQLPSLGKEMYIITDKIKIPVERDDE